MSFSVKSKLKGLAAELLWRARLTHPRARACGTLSIVTFHRVLPATERRAYPFPRIVVTPGELHWLCEFFTRHFICGTLREMHTRWAEENGAARPLLAVTFDDGQADNFTYAAPVLASHGIQATFFIPVSAVETQTLLWHDQLGFALRGIADSQGDKHLQTLLATVGIEAPQAELTPESLVERFKQWPAKLREARVEAMVRLSERLPPPWAGLMSWDHIQALAKSGHEIGSHSMSHRLMPECSTQELAMEMTESRRILEARIPAPVDSFCYPNGNTDARSEAAARQAGYRRAVTTRWGKNRPGTDAYRLYRLDMDCDRILDPSGKPSHPLLAWRMSGMYPGLPLSP